MKKTESGLSYSMGEMDETRMDLIDAKVDDDPRIRSTARLNQEIINAFDNWMHNQNHSEIDIIDMISVSMHGTTTILGTLLYSVPKEKRPFVIESIREMLISRFDEMSKIILDKTE